MPLDKEEKEVLGKYQFWKDNSKLDEYVNNELGVSMHGGGCGGGGGCGH
jgi:hypothetical protein